MFVDACTVYARKWIDEDGVEIEIVKSISDEECTMKSEAGDTLEQYYRLTDERGRLIGTNFGEKPFKFMLGNGEVIRGMDTAMTGMCEGERRRVVIPPREASEMDGHLVDGIASDATLYYLLELKSIQKYNPGERWLDDDGLQITVLHKIDDYLCKQAKTGDVVQIHFTLFLQDGTFVDSTKTREPYQFMLGYGRVEGLDRAVNGMCQGEKRRIDIPPSLAKGEIGTAEKIKNDVYLHYQVELVKVSKKDEL
ncbi:unnamed protein product [Thelazia callipaeda]|uniref:peptidylprolyl isomerase n=1 Tax=Thelazia callipaeda TaxID=103827 RepID=A0A0N5D6A4_THECL|nr:unnamed protein product [Thelazia callipaeda]